MDVFNKIERSAVMRSVKSKNTGAEMKVRRLLHAAGYRYCLHAKNLPGKPDIVYPKSWGIESLFHKPQDALEISKKYKDWICDEKKMKLPSLRELAAAPSTVPTPAAAKHQPTRLAPPHASAAATTITVWSAMVAADPANEPMPIIRRSRSPRRV